MNHTYVLGIHPSARGFGWAVFEGAYSPVDWGACDIRKDKNARALGRFEKILDRYRPAVLTMETYDPIDGQRRDRIRGLCEEMVRVAQTRGMTVRLYRRSQIRRVFASEQVTTRLEIAMAVARRVAVLKPRLPKPRPIWIGEHPNIALFQAAACALAYLLGDNT